MMLPYLLEMRSQRVGDHVRQDRNAVLAAFAVADQLLPVCEVDVLDQKTQRLHDAESASIEQIRDQPMLPAEIREDRTHFGRGQNDGHPSRRLGANDVDQPWQPDLQRLPLEEQDGREGLRLRRGRDIAVYRKVREAVADLVEESGARIHAAIAPAFVDAQLAA